MQRMFYCKSWIALFSLIALIFWAAVSVSEAAHISVGINTSYGSNVVYIPGHWYHGYWVPGQYVEYAGPAPGTGYIWYEGGFNGSHRWHHGHWGHGGHHHH